MRDGLCEISFRPTRIRLQVGYLLAIYVVLSRSLCTRTGAVGVRQIFILRPAAGGLFRENGKLSVFVKQLREL